MLALAVPSLATTATVYVLRSSVTPASVRSWPFAAFIPNDAASAPSRVWFSVVPASASVAVTGSPMDVPAGALLDTLRVALAPSVNTGGLLGGAAVASIETVILAKSVPSSAATVTVYVSPAISVTPDLVRSWPLDVLMSNSPRPALPGCRSACRPNRRPSPRRAAQWTCPPARLRSRSAWRSRPREHGRVVGPGGVRRPDARIRPVARALGVRRPHLHVVGRARRQSLDRHRRYP